MPCLVVNLHHGDAFDVFIGRPPGGGDPRRVPIGHRGWLGNPFANGDREANIEAFSAYFRDRLSRDEDFRAAVLELADARLACFCHPRPCHGDVIAQWVNARSQT